MGKNSQPQLPTLYPGLTQQRNMLENFMQRYIGQPLPGYPNQGLQIQRSDPFVQSQNLMNALLGLSYGATPPFPFSPPSNIIYPPPTQNQAQIQNVEMANAFYRWLAENAPILNETFSPTTIGFTPPNGGSVSPDGTIISGGDTYFAPGYQPPEQQQWSPGSPQMGLQTPTPAASVTPQITPLPYPAPPPGIVSAVQPPFPVPFPTRIGTAYQPGPSQGTLPGVGGLGGLNILGDGGYGGGAGAIPSDPRMQDLYRIALGTGAWMPESMSTALGWIERPENLLGSDPNSLANSMISYLSGASTTGIAPGSQNWLNAAQQYVNKSGLYGDKNLNEIIGGISGYMAPQGGMFPGFLDQAQGILQNAAASPWANQIPEEALGLMRTSGNVTDYIPHLLSTAESYRAALPQFTGEGRNLVAAAADPLARFQDPSLSLINQAGQQRLGGIAENLITQGSAGLQDYLSQIAQTNVLSPFAGISPQAVGAGLPAATQSLQQLGNLLSGTNPQTQNLATLLSRVFQGSNIFGDYANQARGLIGGAGAPQAPNLGQIPTGLEGLLGKAGTAAQRFDPFARQAQGLLGTGVDMTGLQDIGRASAAGLQPLQQRAQQLEGAYRPFGQQAAGVAANAGLRQTGLEQIGQAGPTGLQGLRQTAAGQIPGVQSATSRMFNALSEAQQPGMWGSAGRGIENMLGTGQPVNTQAGQAGAQDLFGQLRNVRPPDIWGGTQQGIQAMQAGGQPFNVGGAQAGAQQLSDLMRNLQQPGAWGTAQTGIGQALGGLPSDVTGTQAQLGQLFGRLSGAQQPGILGSTQSALQSLFGQGRYDVSGAQAQANNLQQGLLGLGAPGILGDVRSGLQGMMATGQPVTPDTGAIYNALRAPFEDQMSNLREAFGQQGLRYSQPLLFEEGRQRERFAADTGATLAQMQSQAQEAARQRQMGAFGLGQQLGGLESDIGRQNILSALQPLQFGTQAGMQTDEAARQRQLQAIGMAPQLGGLQSDIDRQNAMAALQASLAGGQLGFQASEAARQRQMEATGQAAALGGMQGQFAQQNLANAFQPFQFGAGLGVQAGENALQRQMEALGLGQGLGQAQAQLPIQALSAAMQPLQFGAGLDLQSQEAARQRQMQAISQAQQLGGQQAEFPRQNLLAAMQPLQFGAQFPLQSVQTEFPIAQYQGEFPLQQAAAQLPWEMGRTQTELARAGTLSDIGSAMTQNPLAALGFQAPLEQFGAQFPLQQAAARFPFAQAGLQGDVSRAAQLADIGRTAAGLPLQEVSTAFPIEQFQGQFPMQQAGAALPWAQLGANQPLQQAQQLQQLGAQASQFPFQEFQAGFPATQFQAQFPFQQIQAGLPIAEAQAQFPQQAGMSQAQIANMMGGLQLGQMGAATNLANLFGQVPLQQAAALQPWAGLGAQTSLQQSQALRDMMQAESGLRLQQAQGILPFQQQELGAAQNFMNMQTPLLSMYGQLPIQQAQAMQGLAGQQSQLPLQQLQTLQPFQQQQIQGLQGFLNQAAPFVNMQSQLPLQQMAALQPFQQQQLQGTRGLASDIMGIGGQQAQFALNQAQTALPWVQEALNTEFQRAQQAFPMAQSLQQYPLQLALQGAQIGQMENQLRTQDLNAIYQEFLRQSPFSNPLFQSALQYGMGIPGATQSSPTPWGSIAGAGISAIKIFIPACFAGDTEVLMSDGATFKRIDDVAEGDELMGHDLVRGEVRKVSKVFRHDNTVVNTSVNGLLVTNHPFYMSDGNLKMVDDVVHGDRFWGDIHSNIFDIDDFELAVFNLEFESGFDFFVLSNDGWLRVHNGRDYDAIRSEFTAANY